MKQWNPYSLVAVTPFESPDEQLALALHRAGAFSVLDIGHQPERGREALARLSAAIGGEFGIRIPQGVHLSPGDIPSHVGVIILADGRGLDRYPGKKILVQATDAAGAVDAEKAGAWAVIAKGSESGGPVQAMSSFIFFQALKKCLSIPVFVQGGCGFHTAPAVLAAGAQGVVFDSQLALLRESRVPDSLKAVIRRLDGTETTVRGGRRVYSRPDASPAGARGRAPLSGGLDAAQDCIPMGQDVGLAKAVHDQCKSAESFVFSLKEAVHAHIRQARELAPWGPDSRFARAFKLGVPIAQGPMASISESPEFAASVAEKGGLPFMALSTFTGERAAGLLGGTAARLGEKSWGVGMLGFLPKAVFSEQLDQVVKAAPSCVLIAGGRPSQTATLEKAGIPAFLHVPTPGLLDLFLNEGARRFVFEGRECGGHIGPLSSFVLWEQQIERLLRCDRLDDVSLLFAGGIHDALSSAMLAVMTAPLVARGAQVGLLMGTGYLYTVEAVRTGALLQNYQDKAVAERETRLLATAPGHETRCLPTPYVHHFETEKLRLSRDGGKGEKLWKALEQMNMGRLRIASCGMKWTGEALVPVGASRQEAEGLYMIGQVASLRGETTTVAALHGEVAQGAMALVEALEVPPYPKTQVPQVDIAVIGMACIFPESPDRAAFWKNILDARNLIREVPDIRWNKAMYYDPEAKKPESGLAGKKTNTKWGGFLPFCYFNPLDYGIPPQSLAAIDPVQLLSLHVAAGALADAGYEDREFDRENTSVIFGVEAGTDLAGAYGLRNIFPQYFGEIPPELDAVLPSLTEDSFPGVLGNVISGRIANRLDLGGRNYTVDAACASSLAAIDAACRELASGGSNLVIAGGADSHNSINDYLMFSSLYTLSSGDRSKPFDAETDGLCMGEGVAAIVLKRHGDALRDGDRVYAVIKGMGGASDGKSLGLTAPRKEGQVKAISRAYAHAGISAADVGLIEAHGTGTVVGDRTELSSLTETFGNAGATRGACVLGTVKSQIGHAKCAAGMAGVIKAALSVYHGVLPPTINVRKTNAFYDPETSPFVFRSAARPWLAEERIAGVSAFGFGGTNFHLVLKNGPEPPPTLFSCLEEWPAELILVRGRHAEDAAREVRKIREFLSLRPDARLRDLAYSLAVTQGPVFAAVVAESGEDLTPKLAAVETGGDHPDVHYVRPVAGKVAFLFAGQGSQRPGMLSDIFVAFPFLRETLARVSGLVPPLYPPDAFSPEEKARQKDAVTETVTAQQLLGTVSMAMAGLLKRLGVVPEMLGGHSYGEIPALCYAGVIDPDDVVAVSEHRARAIVSAVDGDPGKMAAVLTGKEALEACLAEVPGVGVANHNGPKQSVIAGSSDAVTVALGHLKACGITARELPVACAFHSPVIHRAQAAFSAYLAQVPLKGPSLPVWSNTTAEPYPDEPEKIRARLAAHLVKPVRFAEQVKAMEEDGAAVFIELGPGAVLTGLVRDIIGDTHRAFATDQKGENGLRCLVTALARYTATGRSVATEALFAGRGATAFDLDDPDSYKPAPAVWAVNGHRSVPVSGTLPDTAMQPVASPLRVWGGAASGGLAPGATRDETVTRYLTNVKEIMQAQRDVMLGYLGAPPAGLPKGASSPDREAGGKGPEDCPTRDPSPEPQPVKELLLAIIAEKTGYPTEMLDLTLDLEADLSIDSIKRIEIIGELSARIGLEAVDDSAMEEAMEELAAIKTIAGIVTWLEDKERGRAPAPAGGAAWSRGQIRETLIDIVAMKTGYPPEMLDLTLDLEADLSIDSIKRIEILGELNTRLSGVSETGDNPEALMEELAAIKTLEGIIDWVHERASGQDPGRDALHKEGVPDPRSEPQKEASGQAPALTRYQAVLARAPVPVMNGHEIAGRTFALAGDNPGVAERLREILKEKGATVQVVTGVDETAAMHHVDGLIHLSPLSATTGRGSVMDLFDLVKQTNPRKLKWVCGVTALGGDFGEASAPGAPLKGYRGEAGFIKSLSKEWRTTRCRYIDVSPDAQPAAIAEHIVDELRVDDTFCEIAYADGRRRLHNIRISPLNKEGAGEISLDRDSVILALGGAKGITASVVRNLAERYGCTFVLVGRSPLPEAGEASPFDGISSVVALRQALIAQGTHTKPSEIEARLKAILSERQLKETFAAIEEKGGRWEYVSLDVTDETAFSGLIHELYAAHGRIDGVLHGAGVIDDKFLNQKSRDSFQRVVATKTVPARVLSETLREDVRFVAFFSSIAAAFGNKGQVDYASANDTLDKLAIALNRRIDGRAFSVNWGPWAGRGMVSEALSREYEKAGIGLIQPEPGGEALLDELRYGKKGDTRVILMCGSPESMLLQGGLEDG